MSLAASPYTSASRTYANSQWERHVPPAPIRTRELSSLTSKRPKLNAKHTSTPHATPRIRLYSSNVYFSVPLFFWNKGDSQNVHILASCETCVKLKVMKHGIPVMWSKPVKFAYFYSYKSLKQCFFLYSSAEFAYQFKSKTLLLDW